MIRMEQAGERQEYVWRDDNIVEIKYGNDEGETNVTRYTYYGELANKENFDVFCDRISWDEELVIAGVNGYRVTTCFTKSAVRANGHTRMTST